MPEFFIFKIILLISGILSRNGRALQDDLNDTSDEAAEAFDPLAFERASNGDGGHARILAMRLRSTSKDVGYSGIHNN